MSYFPAYTERQTLAGVTAALEQAGAERIQRANTIRLNRSPPRCPPSGETTLPPSRDQDPREMDDYERDYRHVEKRYKGAPYSMFQLQRRWEINRLNYQSTGRLSGRRQTLPFDQSLDMRANAENNVRSLWAEQGMWDDGWGPAWPSDSHPIENLWFRNQSLPLHCPQPVERWAHEEHAPVHHEKESLPVPELPYGPTLFSSVQIEEEHRGPADPPPATSVRCPQASRPYDQFFYQVFKEREWLKDELDWRPQAQVGCGLLDSLAFDSVKRMWQENELWQSEWEFVPGETWAYEQPDQESENEPLYRTWSRPSGVQDTNTLDGQTREDTSLSAGSSRSSPLSLRSVERLSPFRSTINTETCQADEALASPPMRGQFLFGRPLRRSSDQLIDKDRPGLFNRGANSYRKPYTTAVEALQPDQISNANDPLEKRKRELVVDIDRDQESEVRKARTVVDEDPARSQSLFSFR